ncbi:MAG TPA: class I tRNA ligase family protein, partial [Nitrososphaerales archaeon]|nr:class I tRNA ligase family protein [Nitrososphaerales archaeon]
LRPETGDINFGWDSFTDKINTDLNDTIGNFVNRTLVGVAKFADNSFEISFEKISEEFKEEISTIQKRHNAIRELYEDIELQSACREILEQVARGNRFLSSTEPWKVVKVNKAKALEILYVALSTLKAASCELYPIIPDTVSEIVRQSGLFKKSNGVPSWEEIGIDSDLPIKTIDTKPIFSKVKASDLKDRLEKLRKAPVSN